MFHLLEAEDRANKAALLLAHERYQREFAPFVKNAARLEYAKRDLFLMLDEVCSETGGDVEKVARRFMEVLAEHQKMNPDGLPSGKNVKEQEGLEDIKHTDVMDRGDVEGAGLEEALNPDGLEKQDLTSEGRVKAYAAEDSGNLKDQSTWKPCFRCGNKLNPVAAQLSPVCPECTHELRREAVSWAGDEQQAGQPDAVTAPVNPNQQFQCVLCVKNGQMFTGTRDQVMQHVEQAHADEIQQSNPPANPSQGTPQTFSRKQAEREEVVVNEPNAATPADRFDDLIQQIADRAAARQFSQPDEEEVRAIAQQYGLEESDVRENLIMVATFGTFTAKDGELVAEDQDGVFGMEGYTEVQNVGGRVDSHEALIPVDIAVAKVADEMNMQRDLVYNMVRDKYGADLPDKYHASVSGEHHFYLPQTLIGEQNEVGPSANPDVAAQEAAPVA